MKKLYTLVVLIALSATAHAQGVDWAARAGSWAYDYGYGIQTDASGNVYVAGKYEENANFGNTSVTCAGNHDMFIAKYGPDGSFQWVRTGGGPDGDYARALAVDPTGNSYVAGEIEGTAMFDNTTVNGNPGTNDGFVAKYNSSGVLQWVINLGGFGNDKARGIAVDAGGNSYVVGPFTGTATFGSTTFNSNGGEDAFFVKISPTGQILWAKRIGGTGEDQAKGVGVDATGNVYIAGEFMNTITVESTTLTSAGLLDSYVAKFDPNGNLQWIKQVSGLYDDAVWALSVDPLNQVYITGEHSYIANYGNGITSQSNGLSDIFLAAFDGATGNALWATSMGGNLGEERGRGVYSNGTMVAVTGQFGQTATFGNTTMTAEDSSDIFIAVFNTSGAFQKAMQVKGGPDAFEDLGYEAGNAVYVDAAGKVYATGSYLGTAKMDWAQLNPYTRTDAWIAKIDFGRAPSPVSVAELDFNDVSLYPNPASHFFKIVADNMDFEGVVEISNSYGQIVLTKQNAGSTIDVGNLANGVYTVKAGEVTKKLVVNHN